MNKTKYLLCGIVASMFLCIVGILLLSPHFYVYAATSENEKIDVSVTGDGIIEGNTYYLQWSGLSLTYNGEGQKPSAILKCHEDADFSVEATINVQSKAGADVIAENVGAYDAIATCNGINFAVGDNVKEFSITHLRVEVDWDTTETFTYNGKPQGPKASYTNLNREVITLNPSGWGKDAGTHTASVTADAAGSNYLLVGKLSCEYEIKKCPISVDWDTTETFTYNGKPQGPKASYTNLRGEVITLTPSGWGKDAGTTHTARVSENPEDSNYVLTDFTCNYEIKKCPVPVYWDNTGTFTYNGKPQGPKAYYTNLEGEIKSLTPSGWGTNAGTHTARVLENPDDENYVLAANLTCNYEIGKFVAKILWVVGNYTDNGQLQGPRAFIVGVNGDVIELPLKNYGTKAGNYTVEIDLSQVDSNFELSGEKSCLYEISPENQFGPSGVALSVTLGVISCIFLIGLICLFVLRKKKEAAFKITANNDNSKLQEKINSQNRTIDFLKEENTSLERENADILNKYNQSQSNLAELEMRLDNSNKELAEIKKQAANADRELTNAKKQLSEANRKLDKVTNENAAEIDKLKVEVTILTDKVKSLNEENKKLKLRVPEFYKRPIEDYLPDIDETFEFAESCDYDPERPQESFLTQRQKFREVMKYIAMYRSQRR